MLPVPPVARNRGFRADPSPFSGSLSLINESSGLAGRGGLRCGSPTARWVGGGFAPVSPTGWTHPRAGRMLPVPPVARNRGFRADPSPFSGSLSQIKAVIGRTRFVPIASNFSIRSLRRCHGARAARVPPLPLAARCMSSSEITGLWQPTPKRDPLAPSDSCCVRSCWRPPQKEVLLDGGALGHFGLCAALHYRPCLPGLMQLSKSAPHSA
jgi:hypothetical protein